MTILETINSVHADELRRLNDCILKQLESGSPLMGQIVAPLMRTKGKQLRPLMLMLVASLFSDVDDRTIAAAAAIELIHNASLIHDDVVDNSPTRRNKPTVNAVWDNHIAVLVGDYFTSSAMQQAIRTGDIRIVDSLSSLGRNLSLGEIDQIYNARQHTLTEETYYHIIDYKTASLFRAAAEMGCYVAGADDECRQILLDYARLFGRCFQIRDDVFDYFPSAEVGKPTGNDLREGKVTLPLLYALSRTDHPEQPLIMDMLRKEILTDVEIARIQAFARDCGGIEYAFEVMNELRQKACTGLERLPDSPVRRELTELFDFIIARNF